MKFRRIRSATIAVAFLLTAASFGAPASAQLPEGMSPGQVQSILGSPITVPAGESMTVDVGVPVSGGHQGAGWNVTSTGTSVTVVAPEEDGASVSVPMSAAGQTVTITLVADQGVEAPAPAPAEVETQEAPTSESATSETQLPDATDTSNHDEMAAPAPQESNESSSETTTGPATEVAAAPVDTEVLDFEAEIEGNTITAKLGLRQAAQLASKFADVGREGIELDYRDAEGNLIEGVDHEIDTTGLSATFIYPEGTTPDNPFLVEVVRDGEILTTARFTAPGASGQAQQGAIDSPQAPAQDDDDFALPLMLGAAGLFVVIIGAVAFFIKRNRNRRELVS